MKRLLKWLVIFVIEVGLLFGAFLGGVFFIDMQYRDNELTEEVPPLDNLMAVHLQVDQNGQIYRGAVPVEKEDLRAYLRKVHNCYGPQPVFVAYDSGLNYLAVDRVLDAIGDAGFYQIMMETAKLGQFFELHLPCPCVRDQTRKVIELIVKPDGVLCEGRLIPFKDFRNFVEMKFKSEPNSYWDMNFSFKLNCSDLKQVLADLHVAGVQFATLVYYEDQVE